jgi:hypothetical protein
VFGTVGVAYVVGPVAEEGSRLRVRLRVRRPPGVVRAALNRLLPLGDLIMLRRQLLNLRDRAERGARDGRAAAPGAQPEGSSTGAATGGAALAAGTRSTSLRE